MITFLAGFFLAVIFGVSFILVIIREFVRYNGFEDSDESNDTENESE